MVKMPTTTKHVQKQLEHYSIQIKQNNTRTKNQTKTTL
tara:strand:- start:39 stop:152 length:114 start_codon:yes stop_codon:yes gene_type:complete